jgi:hypothetical protein
MQPSHILKFLRDARLSLVIPAPEKCAPDAHRYRRQIPRQACPRRACKAMASLQHSQATLKPIF